MKLVDQLRELANLPNQLRSVTELVRHAMQPAPAFVFVLVQAQHTDGCPVSLGVSAEIVNGSRVLEVNPYREIQNITVLLFADMRRVRLEGITVGQDIVGIASPLGTPLAYFPSRCRVGTPIRVSVSVR